MNIMGFPQVFFDFLYQNQGFAYTTNGFYYEKPTLFTFFTLFLLSPLFVETPSLDGWLTKWLTV